MTVKAQEMPLVSVIVPVFNGAQHLAEALDSIFSQTYDKLEVLVIDDGSTDGTREVVRHYKSKLDYTYQTNQGPAAARNSGIEKARGSLIAFLDADDIWMPEKLQEQMSYLVSHPDCQCVTVMFRHFVEPGAIEIVKHRREWLDKEHTSRLLSGLVVRNAVFDRVGLFDKNLRFGEDIEWLLRLANQGIDCPAIGNVPFQKRIHKDNVSNQTAAMRSDTLSALRRGIRRKRGETK